MGGIIIQKGFLKLCDELRKARQLLVINLTPNNAITPPYRPLRQSWTEATSVVLQPLKHLLKRCALRSLDRGILVVPDNGKSFVDKSVPVSALYVQEPKNLPCGTPG